MRTYIVNKPTSEPFNTQQERTLTLTGPQLEALTTFPHLCRIYIGIMGDVLAINSASAILTSCAADKLGAFLKSEGINFNNLHVLEVITQVERIEVVPNGLESPDPDFYYFLSPTTINAITSDSMDFIKPDFIHAKSIHA